MTSNSYRYRHLKSNSICKCGGSNLWTMDHEVGETFAPC